MLNLLLYIFKQNISIRQNQIYFHTTYYMNYSVISLELRDSDLYASKHHEICIYDAGLRTTSIHHFLNVVSLVDVLNFKKRLIIFHLQ